MSNLKNNIISKKLSICVVGLGYVGYPLLKLISKRVLRLLD